MVQIELFGKSAILGKIGGKWHYHSVTASRPKTLKDLVFRAHPQYEGMRMAKVYLHGGYEIRIVPVFIEHGYVYDCGYLYDIEVRKNGELCEADDPLKSPFFLYSEESANALLLYLQSKSKGLELTHVKYCLSRVYGVYFISKTCLLWLSLLYNKLKDKALWQI